MSILAITQMSFETPAVFKLYVPVWYLAYKLLEVLFRKTRHFISQIEWQKFELSWYSIVYLNHTVMSLYVAHLIGVLNQCPYLNYKLSKKSNGKIITYWHIKKKKYLG